jgi:hypothetical protein
MRMRSAILAAVCLAGPSAGADDGWLYFNGAPKLMYGMSQIRMVREFVRVKIYEGHSRVYCRFVFRNDGPATVARIGFPDGDTRTDDDQGYAKGAKLKSSMGSFRSCVDGKATAITLERSKETENELLRSLR